MRPDKQKLQATQKEGAKDEARDLEHRGQLKAPSKQGHKQQEAGQDVVRRQSGEDDDNPSRH